MRILLIISLLFFSLNFAHSQVVDPSDEESPATEMPTSEFSVADEFGWEFFGSIGIVLLPDANKDADEYSLPSVALGLEHKFNKWFGSDVELLYFQHSDEVLFEGDIVLDRDIRNIVLSLGGNFYLDNSSIFTPYLSADLGISNNNIHSDSLGEGDEEFFPVLKTGGGFDLNFESVSVGIFYDYVMIGLKHKGAVSHLEIDNYTGHRIELRVGF